MRALLAAIELPYRWVVGRRNRQYDRQKKLAHRVDVPVVSVGNLTLGGTGKTPVVEWIARHFTRRQIRVAIISRGYGATPGQNDEFRELADRLPAVPHVQNADRVRAAHRAINQYDAQLLLMDDGFQHRALARDLDVVLLDALEPFGYGRVFPRGALREPLSSLSRADVLMLSRADLITADERAAIRTAAMHHATDRTSSACQRDDDDRHGDNRRPPAGPLWCETRHAPRQLIAHGGGTAPIESLAGCRVAAFCGIGNPAGFDATLQACDYNVVATRHLPDHYNYRPDDLESLTRWAADHQAEAIVCTHKDLVKIAAGQLGDRPLWAVGIEIEFLAGGRELEARLDELLEQPHE